MSRVEPLRILWVLSKLDWSGGIGRLAAGAAPALAERGHEVHVAGPAPEPPPTLDGVTVHAWPRTRWKVGRLRYLVPLQRRLRAQVIHFHTAHPHGDVILGLRALAGTLGRPAIVLSPHSSNPYPKRRHRLGLRAVDRVILSSGWSAERAVQTGARLGRTTVVPNGIDWPEKVEEEGRLPVVLVVSRLVAMKGIALVLDAFARAAEARPGWRLWIIGAGPEREALERRAAGSPCAERIEFFGYVPEETKRRALGQASVGVLFSDRENSPGALLEFQAWGLATVASDVGGIPELARPGADGEGPAALLVRPGDVDGLAATLAGLMDDPARRGALARAARRSSRRLAWPSIAEQYERTYRETLAAPSG